MTYVYYVHVLSHSFAVLFIFFLAVVYVSNAIPYKILTHNILMYTYNMYAIKPTTKVKTFHSVLSVTRKFVSFSQKHVNVQTYGLSHRYYSLSILLFLKSYTKSKMTHKIYNTVFGRMADFPHPICDVCTLHTFVIMIFFQH